MEFASTNLVDLKSMSIPIFDFLLEPTMQKVASLFTERFGPKMVFRSSFTFINVVLNFLVFYVIFNVTVVIIKNLSTIFPLVPMQHFLLQKQFY